MSQGNVQLADSTLERRPGIVARRIAGETILVPTRRRAREMALFTLNEVGSFVWEQLDGARDEDALVTAVTGEFEVDQKTAAADVAAFLRDLRDGDLVQEVTP